MSASGSRHASANAFRDVSGRFLLFASRQEAEASQASQLRGMIQRLAATRWPEKERHLLDIDPATSPVPGTPQAPHHGWHGLPPVGTLDPPDRIIAFDLQSLIWARDYRKVGILAPAGVPASLACLSPPARDGFAFIETFHEALRNTDPLIVFSPDQARALTVLGASNLIRLTFPALWSHKPRDARAAGHVAAIDHIGLPQLIADLATALEQSGAKMGVEPIPDRTGGEFDLEAAIARAAAASIHIHIGSNAASGGLRVIDSFAMRKPVIRFDPPGHAPSPGDSEGLVHLRSGIVAADLSSLQAGLRRLLDDPASVDVFLRNADRLVEVHNRQVEQRLVEALQ